MPAYPILNAHLLTDGLLIISCTLKYETLLHNLSYLLQCSSECLKRAIDQEWTDHKISVAWGALCWRRLPAGNSDHSTTLLPALSNSALPTPAQQLFSTPCRPLRKNPACSSAQQICSIPNVQQPGLPSRSTTQSRDLPLSYSAQHPSA